MTSTCPKCKKKAIADDALFCGYCGTGLVKPIPEPDSRNTDKKLSTEKGFIEIKDSLGRILEAITADKQETRVFVDGREQVVETNLRTCDCSCKFNNRSNARLILDELEKTSIETAQNNRLLLLRGCDPCRVINNIVHTLLKANQLHARLP